MKRCQIQPVGGDHYQYDNLKLALGQRFQRLITAHESVEARRCIDAASDAINYT